MKHRYLKGVATLQLDTEKCVGCGRCMEVCPHSVIAKNQSKVAIVDKDSCMECGACMKNCPVGAIAVDPGVGCASAIIYGFLTGTEPSCGCSETESGCC